MFVTWRIRTNKGVWSKRKNKWCPHNESTDRFTILCPEISESYRTESGPRRRVIYRFKTKINLCCSKDESDFQIGRINFWHSMMEEWLTFPNGILQHKKAMYKHLSDKISKPSYTQLAIWKIYTSMISEQNLTFSIKPDLMESAKQRWFSFLTSCRPLETYQQWNERIKARNTSKETFDCFQKLNLNKGCTENELTLSFLEISSKFSPENGGDPAAFIVISKAYEEAKHLVSKK